MGSVREVRLGQYANLPSEYQIRAVLDRVAPGSAFISIRELAGSYSNFTHVVEARLEGCKIRLVLRRYAVFGDYDCGLKAQREYNTLQQLHETDVPVPRPLILDASGELLGMPGIVTAYVPGTLVEFPVDAAQWGRALAVTLARIHAMPCTVVGDGFLLDANAEASWFLRSPAAPDYMEAHARGAELWRILRDGQRRFVPVPPTLVHLDYWPGNVLWEGGKISAVVDWEEASCGDAAIDVAYCRMDMFIRGMEDTAELFLHAYQAQSGRRLDNLGFWELSAAVRPMFSPEGWISEPLAAERFQRFIDSAIERFADEM